MAVAFDPAHFAHMTGGDAELQREIIGLFRGQVTAWEAALAPMSPAANWRDVAHTLKGSARGIGLWALAEACERAEAESDDTARAGLERLHAALIEALAALPPA